MYILDSKCMVLVLHKILMKTEGVKRENVQDFSNEKDWSYQRNLWKKMNIEKNNNCKKNTYVLKGMCS